MSEAIVVDASVSVAWVHPAQATPQTASLLSRVENGLRLVVPTLWFLEVTNVLVVLTRRKKLLASESTRAFSLLSALNITAEECGAHVAFGEARRIAEQHRLSIYDAIYLELAHRRGLPFASRDEDLNAAAMRMGVVLAC